VWENTIKTTRTWNLKNFQATPEQTATGKGIPNPLMGVAFPKSQWCGLELFRGTLVTLGELFG